MRNGIQEFQPRQPLDRQLGATTLNQILRELESLRITRVVNGTFRKLPGGTEITVAPQRGGGSSTTTHPFQISSRQDPDNENQYLVTVEPGTINNLLPTNLLNGQNLQTISLSADSLRYVTLKATAASNVLTACTIELESSAPSPQEPLQFALPATYDVLLGVVYNSNVRQVVFNNLSVAGRQAYITDKTNPVPGSLPYNVFLQWG
jgi:hypothetical protein